MKILSVFFFAAVFSGAAQASLNSGVSAGGYCYSECSYAGCPYAVSCVSPTIDDIPSCPSSYSSYSGGCSAGSVYCITGESACSYCHSTDGTSGTAWSSWKHNGAATLYRTRVTFSESGYYNCGGTSQIEHGCIAGYYGSANAGTAYMTCSPCPSASGMTVTSPEGNTSIDNCCVAKGSSFIGDNGTGTLESECCYK